MFCYGSLRDSSFLVDRVHFEVYSQNRAGGRKFCTSLPKITPSKMEDLKYYFKACLNIRLMLLTKEILTLGMCMRDCIQ